MKSEQIVFNKIIIISLLFCAVLKLIGAENGEQAASNSTTTSSPLWKDNDIDKLKRNLLTNYDKHSRPEKNQIIKLCYNAIRISLDEHQGIFKIYLWLHLEWQNPKFVWNPKENKGITAINFAAHEIWEPEIVSFNSVDPSADLYPDTLFIVYNNGHTLRVPPREYNVFCDMDFSLWPYDKQNCSIKLGTWASRDIKIAINEENKNCLDASEYIFHTEWRVEQMYSMNRTDPVTKFDYIEFTFQMERHSQLYKVIILIPTSCIVLMILCGFWLPPQCGEKILLNGVNALLIMIFLMYFGRLLPVLSNSTPLIVQFLSSSLLLVSVSMIISVGVIYICDINHEKRLPKWLRNILNGSIGKILCLSHLNTNSTRTPNTEEDEPKNDGNSSQEPQIFELSTPTVPKKSIQNDWIIFAAAIDRFSFIIYSIIFAVLAIKYSV